MNFGMENRPKEHKIKAKSNMTLMLFFDPTKGGITFRIPKWIRFPLLIMIVAIVLGIFQMMVYVADLENQLAMERSQVQSNTYVIDDKEQEIADMEETEEERYNQLQSLSGLTLELKEELQELKEYKETIDEKLGTTEKTTDTKPEEDETSKALEEEILDDNALTKELEMSDVIFKTSPQKNLESFSEPYGNGDIDEMKSYSDDFSKEVNLLMSDLNIALEQIDTEAALYEKREEELDDMLPYWEAYPSVLPLDDTYVTSPYGMRQNPFGYGYEFHSGVDLKAHYEEVWATGSGVVTFAGYTNGYGYLVVIDHGYGLMTKYAHNSKILVEEGDEVERYDVISISGSTGRSSGPHLHYEVLEDGETQNPMDYIYEEDAQ